MYFNNICVWIYDCWIGGGDDSSLSASASTKPNRVAEELYYSASASTTIDLKILALPAISLLLLNVRLHGVGFEFNCFYSRAPDKVIHISLYTGYFKEGLPMTFLYVHCTNYCAERTGPYCFCNNSQFSEEIVMVETVPECWYGPQARSLKMGKCGLCDVVKIWPGVNKKTFACTLSFRRRPSCLWRPPAATLQLVASALCNTWQGATESL